MNENRVPQVIHEIQKAKAQGLYTWNCRPMDRFVNGVVFSMAFVGVGMVGFAIYELTTGNGKKEGF